MRVYVMRHDGTGCCHVAESAVHAEEQMAVVGGVAVQARHNHYDRSGVALCGMTWGKRDSVSQFPQARLCKRCETRLEAK